MTDNCYCGYLVTEIPYVECEFVVRTGPSEPSEMRPNEHRKRRPRTAIRDTTVAQIDFLVLLGHKDGRNTNGANYFAL